MLRHQARPKSQPPIKLSEVVSFNKRRQEQSQQQQQVSVRTSNDEEQHWSKMMEKYEKSRSLRFNGPTGGLKTLSEHQAIGEIGNDLDLNQDEPDISPLTSSDSSSSSGGSSLASSTLSLSSVSSASTVMAVDGKKLEIASSDHLHKAHHDSYLKPFEPIESSKDPLGSDEESSSNSSSCSSSSGISSISQTNSNTESDTVAQKSVAINENDTLTSGNGELERAVAESLEALVSSVVASQSGQCAASIAFDVLMVKAMPINSESLSVLDFNNNLSSLAHDIVNTARRCIFNALTHAQKVGRRESGWRIELQLSQVAATRTDGHHYIRWFKQNDANEQDAHETVVSAELIIDCLVEHELVIWLIKPNNETVNKDRLPDSNWVASSSSSMKMLTNKFADGTNKLDANQAAVPQLARNLPSNQSANSQVCGNLIGITVDCDSDQQIERQHLLAANSVIWLCSNELEAKQVQETWVKFNKWRANYLTTALVDEEDKTRMVAIKSTDFRECSNGSDSCNLLESSGTICDRISVHDNLPVFTIDVAKGLVEPQNDDDEDHDQESDRKSYSDDDCDELDQVEGSEGVVSLAVDQLEISYDKSVNLDDCRRHHEEVAAKASTGRQKTGAAAVKVADTSRTVGNVSHIMTLHPIDSNVEWGNNELGDGATRRQVGQEDRQTTVLANNTTSRLTLKKTTSVFNLTGIGRSGDDSLNHIEQHRHELSFDGLAKARSRVLFKSEPTAVARSNSSNIMTRGSDEFRAESRRRTGRLASNQVVEQQQRTLPKVSSVCDLSSFSQRQQQLTIKSRQVAATVARPASPANKLVSSKQTPNGHPQPRTGIASGVQTATAAVTPTVKPRMSILKRQAASGGNLSSSKEAKARPPSQLVTSINKLNTTRAEIPHDANNDDDDDKEYETNINGNKCDLQRNIDRYRTNCSSRSVQSFGSKLLAHEQNKQVGSSRLESGSGANRSASRVAKGESIDQLNEPFKCSSQSSVGLATSGKRRAVGELDSCAQVVVVSSPAASSRLTTTEGKVAAVAAVATAASDEHLAPNEIKPIARDVRSSGISNKSAESQGIKLDNQPRRLLIGGGGGKTNSPSRQQQQQQMHLGEVCDELQLNRQPVVRQKLVRTSSLAPANGNVNGNSSSNGKHQNLEQLATVNQSKTTTTARRKAVHSLANCELLARHHHNQQLLSATRVNEVSKTNGNSVTIRVLNGNLEQKSEVNTDDNELEFVSSGSVAREQAFERLRQRASCYDITRLMSKNSIIQNQLARLRATGPSRDSLSVSNNDLRQRKPAELLVLEPEKPTGKSEEQATSDQPRNRGDSTGVNKQKNRVNDETEIEQKAVESKPDEGQRSVRSGKSKVPAGGVAVLRHEELDAEVKQKKAANVDEEESELTDIEQDVVNGDDQSTVSEEEEEEEETETKGKIDVDEKGAENKISQTKATGTGGLSKFNLLRQSFNQKTISSMFKFSNRASLRIRTSKPAERAQGDKQEANVEVKEQEIIVAAQSKQIAIKAVSKVDQQQQQQIAALDSATLMLYNRQLQQRQQRQQQQLMQQQQQQQHQYALQWQQHQIYIQQQQQQQQQRQQLAFMANHYVTTHHQHQMLAPTGVPMAIAGYSSAASSMFAAQQMMMMQQQHHQSIQQPIKIATKTPSSNMVGNILRKSILKPSKSVIGKQEVQLDRMVHGAHHYAPSQQQPHGRMVPLEVNHHSSVNIVYGTESSVPPPTNYSHNNPYELNELMLDKQKVKQSVSTGHNLSASSLKASMRKTVRSILVNRTASDDQKKADDKQRQQQQLQQPQKPLKSALKSPIKRSESTLNLNSDGSDGDQSNSSTLESSSSSSDRSDEPPTRLKSALKKSSGTSQDETKLVPILSNSDELCSSSNSSDTIFKRAISARCSRRLTIKTPVVKSQEPQLTNARTSIKPMKKNVTFSTKLTSIQ